jgi:hypothetical protein
MNDPAPHAIEKVMDVVTNHSVRWFCFNSPHTVLLAQAPVLPVVSHVSRKAVTMTTGFYGTLNCKKLWQLHRQYNL